MGTNFLKKLVLVFGFWFGIVSIGIGATQPAQNTIPPINSFQNQLNTDSLDNDRKETTSEIVATSVLLSACAIGAGISASVYVAHQFIKNESKTLDGYATSAGLGCAISLAWAIAGPAVASYFGLKVATTTKATALLKFLNSWLGTTGQTTAITASNISGSILSQLIQELIGQSIQNLFSAVLASTSDDINENLLQSEFDNLSIINDFNNGMDTFNSDLPETQQFKIIDIPNPEPIINFPVTISPNIVDIGDYVDITVSVRNNGGLSNEGGISIGIPLLDQAEDDTNYMTDSTQHSDTSFSKFYPAGSTIYHKNGNQITSSYMLAEFVDTNFAEDEVKTFRITVRKPSRSGDFNILIRSAMRSSNDENIWINAPDVPLVDQQGWGVVRYRILDSNSQNSCSFSTSANRESPSYKNEYLVGQSVKFTVTGNSCALGNVHWYSDSSDITTNDSYDTFSSSEIDSYIGTESSLFTFNGDNGGNTARIYAVVSNSDDATDNATAVWVVSARESQSPVISLIEPIPVRDNYIEVPLGNIDFEVQVSDADGNLLSLEWYFDGVLVETEYHVSDGDPATTKRYESINFTNRGLHTLRVVATDEDNNVAEYVATVETGVASDGSIAPIVENLGYYTIKNINSDSWRYYEDYQAFRMGRAYRFICETYDADGGIIYQEISHNGTVIKTETETGNNTKTNESLYPDITFTNTGSNTISCLVRDNDGLEATKTLTVSVLPADSVSIGSAPQITRLYPTASTWYDDDYRGNGEYLFHFAGHIQDNELDFDTIEVKVDNQLVDVISNNIDTANFSESISVTGSGQKQLQLTPIDSQGNRGATINKTLVLSAGDNAPSIRKAAPFVNQTIYINKDADKNCAYSDFDDEMFVVFAYDPDGDLDKVEWDYRDIRPVYPSCEYYSSDSSYQSPTATVSGYFDESEVKFFRGIKQSGTIRARARDKNNNYSDWVSFDIVYINSTVTQNHAPIIYDLNPSIGNYVHLGDDDVNVAFTPFDPDGDLVKIELLSSGLQVCDSGLSTTDGYCIIKQEVDNSGGVFYTINGRPNLEIDGNSEDFYELNLSSTITVSTLPVRGGSATYVVRLTDSLGNITESSFVITKGSVNQYNHPPIVDSSLTIVADQTQRIVTGAVNLFDEEGDVVTPKYTTELGEDNFIYLDNGNFKYTADTDTPTGTKTFYIIWTDSFGGDATTTVNVVVPERIVTLYANVIGSGDITLNGTVCGNNCSIAVTASAYVELNATPVNGHMLNYWAGNCSGTNNSLTINMDNDKYCTANFIISAPDISLSTNTITTIVGVAIDNITVANTGGVASYSIAPAISNGLSFATATGTISGTPSAVATNVVYTITATNVTGSSIDTVDIIVNPPAPKIAISVATVNAELDIAITDIQVTNSGGTATSYAISPPLVNGLSFATATGTISGTPTATATLQAYTITATNITGSDSATVKISVSQITSKPSIADITATQTYFVDVAIISPITFTNTGGVTQECASSGLPAGLNVSVSGNSCAISGTPQQISNATAYTIIATNSQGSDTAIININIDPATPSITISVNSFTATVGVAITDITVTNTGGTAALYAISQPLSAGLSFNTATGTISGIPSAIASTIIYTITASNVTGADSATLSIEVKNFSLDADGNGTINASNDGLIIFKYLLNSNANNLHTTISSNAMEGRKTTIKLKKYLDNAKSLLDIDGNQTINASNDGLIVFKYLLNSNANNLHTTISSNAMEGRKTTPQLKAYLDKFR